MMLSILRRNTLRKPWKRSMSSETATAVAVPNPELNISKFDIRVGLITSVTKHPNADSLYVETIDLNESNGPRQVLSGLVKYMTESELLNQKVLVCCNLKPAKMRGMDSFGMLLAADKEDKVVLVQPPADTEIGERISVEGFVAEPQAQIDGKKADAPLFAAVFNELKSDSNGVACYKGIPLMTSKGPCTCAFTDAPIH